MHVKQIVLNDGGDSTSVTTRTRESAEKSVGEDVDLMNCALQDNAPLIKLSNYDVLAIKYKTSTNLTPNHAGSDRAVPRRKTGRISHKRFETSPQSAKQPNENKQQANLNSFLQIKEVVNQPIPNGTDKVSPRRYTRTKSKENFLAKTNGSDDNACGFKVSTNLFMSPKGKKAVSRIKSQEEFDVSKVSRFNSALDNDETSCDVPMISGNENEVDVITIDDNSSDKTDLAKEMVTTKETLTLKANAFHFLMDRTRTTPPTEKLSPRELEGNSKKRKLELQNDDVNPKKTKRKKSGESVKQLDFNKEILTNLFDKSQNIATEMHAPEIVEMPTTNKEQSQTNEVPKKGRAKKGGKTTLEAKKQEGLNKNDEIINVDLPDIIDPIKEDHLLAKNEETGVRRSTRVRKSVIDPAFFIDDDFVGKATPKSSRARLSSESSVDSVSSVASSTSGKSGKSKSKKSKSAAKSNTNGGKNDKKIAPIFQKAKPKVQLSPASLAARESFLRSGVPESLKQKQQKLDASRDLEEEFFTFPSVGHVQQRCSSFVWDLRPVTLPTISPRDEDSSYFEEILRCGSLNWCNDLPESNDEEQKVTFPPVTKGKPIHDDFAKIQSEKSTYPSLHLLLSFGDRNGYNYRQNPKSKLSLLKITKGKPSIAENPNQHTMWTKKYRPRSSMDLIGNTNIVKSLKKWLESWLDVVGGPGGEMFDSDGASLLKNTMILYGKPGCGKSATVYALCEELDINVLEVNVSSRRTGKQLLQQMHEATQSHQVRKRNESEAKMCLLLIDDVDLVYQQDENFTRELHTLITTSKRPLILITNDYSVPHVLKYIHQQYPILFFAGLSAHSMATYLQILCLVEGFAIDKKTLGMLLEWNLGDLRRSILQLQFWLASGGDSNQSLRMTPGGSHRRCIQTFVTHSRGKILPEPLDLGILWWNVPIIAGLERTDEDKERQRTGARAKSTNAMDAKEGIKEMKDYVKFMECLSFCDTLNRSEDILGGREPDSYNIELCDSVELNPRTDHFRTDRCLSSEIEQTLLEGYCKNIRSKQLNVEGVADVWSYAAPPKIRRWRSKQDECTTDFLRAVPIRVKQYKTSFHVDYFPYLRELCRSEEHRRENNPKRGQRGFNVLGTAGVYDLTPLDIKTAAKMLQVENLHYV